MLVFFTFCCRFLLTNEDGYISSKSGSLPNFTPIRFEATKPLLGFFEERHRLTTRRRRRRTTAGAAAAAIWDQFLIQICLTE